MTDKPKAKRARGRPVKYRMPTEKVDASPKEIAEVVLKMPPKRRDEWRYLREIDQS